MLYFSVDIEDLCSEMGTRAVDTLYYKARWTIVVLNKIADRRKENVALSIRYFCDFCSIDGNTAKDKGLPTGKVDRVVVFDALTFVRIFISNLLRDWKICLCDAFRTNI